jgi:hypothetical protein
MLRRQQKLLFWFDFTARQWWFLSRISRVLYQSVVMAAGFVKVKVDKLTTAASWSCKFFFFSWIINYPDEFGLMAIASLHNVSVLSSSFLKESQSEAVRRRGDDGGEAPGHRHTCKHSRSLRMSMWWVMSEEGLVIDWSNVKVTERVLIYWGCLHLIATLTIVTVTIMVVLQRVAGASTNEEAKRCLCWLLLSFKNFFVMWKTMAVILIIWYFLKRILEEN